MKNATAVIIRMLQTFNYEQTLHIIARSDGENIKCALTYGAVGPCPVGLADAGS